MKLRIENEIEWCPIISWAGDRVPQAFIVYGKIEIPGFVHGHGVAVDFENVSQSSVLDACDQVVRVLRMELKKKKDAILRIMEIS